MSGRPGFAGRIADALVDSRLVPLIVIGTLLMGAYGLSVIPRQDRPEIEVPTALVKIPFPGAGVARADELVARPVGRWIGGLEQVVEVASVSAPDLVLLRAEFETGTRDAEAFSLLQERFDAHAGELPPGAGSPNIRMIGGDLLAAMAVTLSSTDQDAVSLRLVAEEVAVELEELPGVAQARVHGGHRREIRIAPRPEALAARGMGVLGLAEAVAAGAARLPADSLQGRSSMQVRAGGLPATLSEIRSILVGHGPAGPVRVDDVADVRADVGDRDSATLHWRRAEPGPATAVGLSLLALSDSNVTEVTRRARTTLQRLSGEVLPSSVRIDIAHDAGVMARDTVRSVLENFVGATVTVIVIILFGLGWRAAAGVTLQLPSSLAIVPTAYWLLGFTLDPVSIAAMILAIGLLADDNVIIMENIRRHFRAEGAASRAATVRAVDEVGNPTVLAVFLIIATFIPTAFISGEMGQYTRAIPVGTSLAIGFSLVIALTVTPYVACRVLKPGQARGRGGGEPINGGAHAAAPEGTWVRWYRALLNPFFERRGLRVLLYAALVLLFAGSIGLVVFRAVHVTLVPILDRDVFVIEFELPPGSELTRTVTAGSAMAAAAREFPGVQAATLFAGTEGPNIVPPPGPLAPARVSSHRASLYVQLVPGSERDRASFEIARALAFDRLPPVLQRFDARAWLRRIPSGPSSDNAVQAEIFGADRAARERLADRVAELLRRHPAAAEVERFPKTPAPRLDVSVDRIRAAARGSSVQRVAAAVRTALSGRTVGAFDIPDSRSPVPLVVRLDPQRRASADDVGALRVADGEGGSFALREVASIRSYSGAVVPRYRKNGLPVNYVAAHVDRSRSQPLSVQRDLTAELPEIDDAIRIEWFSPPSDDAEPALFWGGEWETTQQVYRDLGAAAAVVLILIYVVLSGWFGSYAVPLLIMSPIPLVFIGVIPAHWLMDLDIAGLGVLGVIALAGIVVRNAVLLVDFTQRRLDQGASLDEALIGAGAVRTRPILLTAGTVLFGSGALVFEPALEPLGLTLISGVLVSTVLTLLLIPVLYHRFGAEPREAQTES